MLSLLEKTLGVFILVSVITWTSLVFINPPLPKPSEVVEEIIFHTPEQTDITSAEIVRKFPEYTYFLQPVANYHLKGVIVSQHDTKSFTDISHKFDVLNTKDLCIVWGENVANDSYRKVQFSSGDFTCYWRWITQVDPPLINNSVSNNHVIPATEDIRKFIAGIQLGDQIELTGKLVTYKVIDNKTGNTLGERGTSTTREDTGSRACEVLYVTDIRIIKQNVLWWNPVKTLSGYVAIFSLVLWLILISRPARAFLPNVDSAESTIDKVPSLRLKI